MAAFSDTAFSKNVAFSDAAFDFGSGPPPTPPVVPGTQQIIGGGITHDGLLRLGRKKRTKGEISLERSKFGLSDAVAEVVAAVAARQAETLVQDEQKRLDELFREITLRGLEYESRYLEALNIERQRLIDQEIGLLIKRKLDEEMIVMLLAVAACV